MGSRERRWRECRDETQTADDQVPMWDRRSETRRSNRRYDKVPEPIEARGAQREMGRKGNWGARELLGRKGIGAQRELGRKGIWGAKEAKSFGQGCRTPLVGDSEVLFFCAPDGEV